MTEGFFLLLMEVKQEKRETHTTPTVQIWFVILTIDFDGGTPDQRAGGEAGQHHGGRHLVHVDFLLRPSANKQNAQNKISAKKSKRFSDRNAESRGSVYLFDSISCEHLKLIHTVAVDQSNALL